MTAPDLLDAIVARWPGELALAQKPAGWTLVIECPALGLNIGAHAVSRQELADFAQAWERHRDSRMHGPPRCALCGLLSAEHEWDAAGKRRGACRSGGGRYEPQQMAGQAESRSER